MDEKLMLSVGNLVELKGHHLAIEALTQLPANTRLAIVGKGMERERLGGRLPAGLAWQIVFILRE